MLSTLSKPVNFKLGLDTYNYYKGRYTCTNVVGKTETMTELSFMKKYNEHRESTGKTLFDLSQVETTVDELNDEDKQEALDAYWENYEEWN